MGYFISCPITQELFALFVKLAEDDDQSFRSKINTREDLVDFLGGDSATYLPAIVSIPSKEESAILVCRYASEKKSGTTYSDVSEHFVSDTRARWFTSPRTL